MPICVFRNSDGQYQGGHANPPAPTIDPTTQHLLTTDHFPDPRLEKSDGTQLVLRSSAELTAYDSTVKDGKSTTDFDNELLIRAVVTYLVQQINVIRQDPSTVKPNITGPQARTAIAAIYKGLLP